MLKNKFRKNDFLKIRKPAKKYQWWCPNIARRSWDEAGTKLQNRIFWGPDPIWLVGPRWCVWSLYVWSGDMLCLQTTHIGSIHIIEGPDLKKMIFQLFPRFIPWPSGYVWASSLILFSRFSNFQKIIFPNLCLNHFLSYFCSNNPNNISEILCGLLLLSFV